MRSEAASADRRPRSARATEWYGRFRAQVRSPVLASQLQSAADGVRLRPWTELLTAAVVQACRACGWVCAAKAAGEGPLPVARDEYLGIDVLAFEPGHGWRPPVAAFELENSPRDHAVGYALWKVCTVRAAIACLFCYRRERSEAAGLVRLLQDHVLRRLEPGGEVLVVVGTRAAADTFPDGYFRPLRWNPEARELGSMARRA